MDVKPTILQHPFDAIMSTWTKKISEECFQYLNEPMPYRILRQKRAQPRTSKMYLMKWPVTMQVMLTHSQVCCCWLQHDQGCECRSFPRFRQN